MLHFEKPLTAVQLLGNQFRIYRRGRPWSFIIAEMIAVTAAVYGAVVLIMLALWVLVPESVQ